MEDESFDTDQRLASLQNDHRQLVVFMYNGYGMLAAGIMFTLLPEPWSYLAVVPMGWLLYSAFTLSNKLKRYMT